MRLTPLALIAAFAVGSAAPPILPTAEARSKAPSPVRCNQLDGYAADARVRRGGTVAVRQSAPQPPYAPPPAVMPPPPAPPPPPLPPAMEMAAPVVTGSRITPGVVVPPADTARYDGEPVANIQAVADAPVSTFSVDVDTGSYANVRRFLTRGQMPPSAAVRTEEMINYFRYDYPRPADRGTPFSVTTDMSTTPWNPETRLLRVGLRGYDADASERPAANLVFLVDVSGSMAPEDRLPLVKASLSMLADKLTRKDRVSIVVYAGAAGIVLEPTNDADDIKQALACLDAGGSTAGGAGIALAYRTARASFIPGGINRILIATDGDFNVGISNNETLEDMVKRERESGIALTTLGFGDSNYNEALMESIADVGNGNYSYIDSLTEAQKVLDEELSSTLFTIAKDVKIQVEFNPAHVSEYRLIGYENRALAEDDFDNDKVDAGEIGAGHQVTALYEIVPAGAKGWLPERRYAANRPSEQGGRGGELCHVKLRYKLPDGAESKLIERTVPASLIASARRPQGDMAFAAAVAGFGQSLRGDKYLGRFGTDEARKLAGAPRDFYRQEFVKLAGLARSNSPSGN